VLCEDSRRSYSEEKKKREKRVRKSIDKFADQREVSRVLSLLDSCRRRRHLRSRPFSLRAETWSSSLSYYIDQTRISHLIFSYDVII
jgi:hypothetical protein